MQPIKLQQPVRGSPLVVSCGGGVNSTAMLILMYTHNMRPDAILFADTGGEKPHTYQFLKSVLAPYLRLIEFPQITIVHGQDGPETTLEADCLRKMTLPSLAYGFRSCSDKWKRRPQRKWLRTWQPALDAWACKLPATFCIGYDHDETHRKPLENTRNFHYRYPLRDAKMGREACIELIKKRNLPVPDKSSCFFCPATRKTDILRLHQCNPGLINRALLIEKYAFASGNAKMPRGLGRHWSWTDLVNAPESTRKKYHDSTDLPCDCWDGSPDPDDD